MTSYVFDAAEDPNSRRRRRKNIAEVLAEHADGRPIQSPWQGAAKMASAGIAGLLLGMEEKKDEERLAAQNAYGAKLDSELSGGVSPVTKALSSFPEGRGATAPADLAPLFDEASKATGIPAPILMAKVRQESNFNPNAVGGAGEVGLAQILPSTARDPGFGMQGVDPAALKDPRTNIMFGAQYLAARGKAAGVKDWNDPQQVAKALAAYNGGGDPNYVQNVMRFAPKGMFAAGSGQTTLAGGDNLTGGRTMTDANRLMQIATDPMAPPQIRERAKMMLQQMPKPRDPLDEEAKRLQIEKTRRELGRPLVDPLEQRQRELAVQKAERELQGEGATPLTDAERQQYGIPKGQAAYKTRDGGIKFGPAGTTVKSEGAIPPGHRAIRDADGNILSVEPIPGTKEDKAVVAKREATTGRAQRVVSAIDDIEKQMKESRLPTTGLIGNWLSGRAGTAAHDISKLVDTIEANVSFEELGRMREQSPTGAALGSVTERELMLLGATIASLRQSQTEGQFKKNLQKVRDSYLDIIHGPGNRPKEQAATPAPGEPAAGTDLKKKYGLD